MRRRDLLGAAGVGVLGGLAGCTGLFDTRSARAPPLPDRRPNDAVYVPTHVEGMAMVGTATAGPYRCALSYTFPHRFWLVTGTRTEKVTIRSADSAHLMVVLWDAETGVVPVDINPQISVSKGGESVAQVSPWPMLSQPMGVHFGDNVALDGDGTYAVTVETGEPSIARTGALADNAGGVSFDFEFDFSRSKLNDLSFEDIPAEREGTTGTVDPMGMEALPDTRAPAREDLPGTVRGEATSADARFVVTTLDDATPFGGSESDAYLAVSPRTPHIGYVLPLMSLSATLARGSATLHDGPLAPALDPALDYHYGAVVPGVEGGESLTITVDAPPQLARHEGYEMAFVDMPAMELTL